jgi:hypothetical protein
VGDDEFRFQVCCDALEAYGRIDLIRVRVRVTAAGAGDGVLLDADRPIGSPADRDARTQDLGDALNNQNAAGC